MNFEFMMALDKRLHERQSLLSLWQEIALNFYPERADFTSTRTLGDEYASHLMTGYPCAVRRDLSNMFGTMLRPSSKEWAHIRTNDWDSEAHDGKQWLESASKVQQRAMYDPIAGFTRATKEADDDVASFGQAVISVELNLSKQALRYACHHLRDVAWQEDENQQICTISRMWKPTAHELIRTFGKDNVHKSVNDVYAKDPFCVIECRHMVLPSDMWKGKQYRTPYVSVFFDVGNKHVMREEGSWTKIYCIPRWKTMSESQYALSPATMIALPDARQLQAQARILLEAGEKAVDPPIAVRANAVAENWDLMAGGITAFDIEMDQNIRDSFALVTNDKTGMPIGFDMQRDTREQVYNHFYLNKLSMPDTRGAKTAYEASILFEEHVRQSLPLFEPIEADYNGQLCEMTFETLFRAGAFGRVPDSIRGAQIQFVFESPFRDAIERAKSQKFVEVGQLMSQAMAIEPSVRFDVDTRKFFREAVEGIAGASVMRSQEEADEMSAMAQEQAQMAQMMGAMEQGAGIAKTMSEAAANVPEGSM